MQTRLLNAIARDMRTKHGCHTLILYGSHARGDATHASDIDLIGLRRSGPETHDARKFRGVYLDAFIYAEKGLKASHLLRARDGVVVF